MATDLETVRRFFLRENPDDVVLIVLCDHAELLGREVGVGQTVDITIVEATVYSAFSAQSHAVAVEFAPSEDTDFDDVSLLDSKAERARLGAEEAGNRSLPKVLLLVDIKQLVAFEDVHGVDGFEREVFEEVWSCRATSFFDLSLLDFDDCFDEAPFVLLVVLGLLRVQVV